MRQNIINLFKEEMLYLYSNEVAYTLGIHWFVCKKYIEILVSENILTHNTVKNVYKYKR